MKIYPSLLSSDFGRLLEEVRAVEAAGADGLHVDVMDGAFVPNLTLGPVVLKGLKGRTKLPLDCHLMVQRPDDLLEAFRDAGATGITVHVESGPHLQRTLARIRELGCRPGVSINPATPFESLEWVLDDVDLILSMTVNPGFGGQKLIPAALRKTEKMISWIKSKTDRKIEVQIDGGLNAQNSTSVRNIGVDIAVAGTAVFGAKDYTTAIRELKGLP